jgi:hypothetical protein
LLATGSFKSKSLYIGEALLALVNEVDVYVAQQLRRYDGAVNVRKTAMEVAKDSKKENE